jgi:hypothetical protein
MNLRFLDVCDSQLAAALKFGIWQLALGIRNMQNDREKMMDGETEGPA